MINLRRNVGLDQLEISKHSTLFCSILSTKSLIQGHSATVLL